MGPKFLASCLSILLALQSFVGIARSKTIKVAVVQPVVETSWQNNLAKMLQFIDRAQDHKCNLVVFPEHCLVPWDAPDKPVKSELDDAFERIRQHAQAAKLCLVFSNGFRQTTGADCKTYGIVYTEEGARAVMYRENLETPQPFLVRGVPCNLSVCSDRGYLELSDLPCVALGTQIIVDSSGGHGGDDGGAKLPLIRYRPWAARTGAWVIVSNPVHTDTDFMGRSPWGGGSAIIRPDGSVLAKLDYQPDAMLVETIDVDLATRVPAEQRRHHPVFEPFWQRGVALLEHTTCEAVAGVEPYVSVPRNVKIVAAQVACSRNVDVNVERICQEIARAADSHADVVVFPELAVTGDLAEDIRKASAEQLDKALQTISDAAKQHRTYAIVGLPLVAGCERHNGAAVIGDDGEIKTRYAQLAVSRSDLFTAGQSAKSLWFRLKGVPAIVTIGSDADWVEIGDLAANRGMILHFHLSYDADANADRAMLRKQRNIQALRYAQFGAVVNAADPTGLTDASGPASGDSMIVCREGGHNRPSPSDVEYYLPYQTSIVCSSSADPATITASRKVRTYNTRDLDHHWRNKNREQGSNPARKDWIVGGATLIGGATSLNQ